MQDLVGCDNNRTSVKNKGYDNGDFDGDVRKLAVSTMTLLFLICRDYRG